MTNEILNRFVSLEIEDAYGVENSSANTIYMGEVDDESFATRKDLLTRQDMSHYASAKSVTGGEYSEGGYNMAVQLDTFLGATLLSFFPKYSENSDIHLFEEPVTGTEAEAGSFPYDSFTIRVGREEKEHTYVGMMSNRLSLSASVGEYVTMSADWVGCTEKDTTALSSSSLSFSGDALDALYFANGEVTFNNNGSVATGIIKSISFEVNMNRDTDNAYALGSSTYVRAPPSQRMEVTGSIEFNQVIHTAVAGSPTYDTLIDEDGLALNPGSSNDALKLVFKEEDGSGGSSATDYMEIQFYNIRFEAPEASVSGRDTQTMTVGFVALYDDTAEAVMDVALKGGGMGTAAIDWNA
tara:strand:- start:5129 stop:6190 length:1062 start_codon:yes stop_codon:yes gene_type:complete